MIPKTELRRYWSEIRRAVPATRRNEAACQLMKIEWKAPVLSFSSFGSEIDTHMLNQQLASQEMLALPRVEKNNITVHWVKNLENDLLLSKWGMLEPDPSRCPEVDLLSIKTVLVPGIAFDSHQMRLGYGRGYYDRFLPRIKCLTIGIAFREQKADSLPSDSWDIPLQKVLYF
ncbi:MAG: 5-formyltetrahydrofolate cyclo-ligase [Verrucomicrobia bacterium]|nr:5-formyltetrahydrofolate cyclo-ligase [Verrucomicrobiota bacterium]